MISDDDPVIAGDALFVSEAPRPRVNLITVLLVVFLVVTAGLTFAWPDDWVIHTPLAALFGPWLAIRLGAIPVAVIGLVAFIAFVTPSCFRPNKFTLALLTLGFLTWAAVGGLVGQILWA